MSSKGCPTPIRWGCACVHRVYNIGLGRRPRIRHFHHHPRIRCGGVVSSTTSFTRVLVTCLHVTVRLLALPLGLAWLRGTPNATTIKDGYDSFSSPLVWDPLNLSIQS